MSNKEKLKKLGNAIRAYKGTNVTDRKTGDIKWIVAPQKSKLEDIKRYLSELGLSEHNINIIDMLKERAEFERLMKRFEELTGKK